MSVPRGSRFDLRPLLERRRLVLTLAVLVAVGMIPGLARLKSDNSPESFFVRDHSALETLRELEGYFGPDRALRIVAEGEGIWEPGGLSWLRQVEREAGQLGGVRGAMGLWGHHQWQFAAWPPREPVRFKAQVLANRLDREMGWVSRDGATVTTLVAVGKLSHQRRWVLLSELEHLIASPPAGVTTSIVGLPVVSREWDREESRFAVRYFPALVLLTLALLIILLRVSVSDALLPLSLVAFCELVVFGTMGYVGQRVNLVLMVLAPLLFVIALATATHLLLRFRELRSFEGSLEDAVIATYRDKGWPVFWSAFTTWVGFGSMAVSRTPAVQALGVWSAFAIAVMALAAFTVYPALLALAPGREGRAIGRFERWASRHGSSWAFAAIRRRGLVFAVAAIAVVLATLGLMRLKVSTDLLSYLPVKNAVRQTIEHLQRVGIGSLSAELLLREEQTRKPRSNLFTSRPMLERSARLSAELRSQQGVLGAVGAGDVLSDVDDALKRLTGSRLSDQQEAAELVRRWPAGGRLISSFLTNDGLRTRIAIFVRMESYHKLAPVLARAERLAREAFPGVEAHVTGQFPLTLLAAKTAFSTMVLSFSLTLLVIAMVFRFLVGTLRVVLMTLVPNVLPVVLALGLMGGLGVPLDGATVMIAAVVLGLAVDDSIHTIAGFRWELRDRGPGDAVAATLTVTAPAQILSSVILAAGFAVCGLADFLPIARFGAFVAVAVLIALLADLLLMPPLLATLSEREVEGLLKRRGSSGPVAGDRSSQNASPALTQLPTTQKKSGGRGEEQHDE